MMAPSSEYSTRLIPPMPGLRSTTNSRNSPMSPTASPRKLYLVFYFDQTRLTWQTLEPQSSVRYICTLATSRSTSEGSRDLQQRIMSRISLWWESHFFILSSYKFTHIQHSYQIISKTLLGRKMGWSLKYWRIAVASSYMGCMTKSLMMNLFMLITMDLRCNVLMVYGADFTPHLYLLGGLPGKVI